MPQELRKAAVMFRKILAADLVPLLHSHDEVPTLKPRQVADARALIALASVCRHWSLIFATSNRSSRRLIRQSFGCE